MMGWRTKDVLRTAALVMAMWIAGNLFWVANQLFLAAFLGILFGLAVGAGVDRLQRLGLPRGLSAAIIVLSFFGLLVGFGAWMAPTLRTQGAELRHKLPEALDRVQDWANKRQNSFIGLILNPGNGLAGDSARGDTAAAGTARRVAPNPTLSDSQPAAPAPPSATASDSARKSSAAGDTSQARSASGGAGLRERITSQLSGVTKYLFPFLSSTLAAVAGTLLIIFLSIYIATDPDLYHRGLMHLFPHRARQRAGEVLSAMATMLRKWLVTQLIAMAVIGTVTTILLLALKVKAAFALGLLAGLFEFIPTVGPILSAVPAIAMGFLDSPEKALWVTLAYVLIQFAENHLLIPLLMKGGVDVPPVLTIMSQAMMALLFGFLGLMTAVPLTAATLVAVKMLYVEGVVGDDVAVVNVNPARDRAVGA
jgi:predicted PurR-regulated permease PerM